MEQITPEKANAALEDAERTLDSARRAATFLRPQETVKGFIPAYKRKFTVITANENEKEYTYRAPFTDKNGHELWSDDLVVNDDGVNMVLRFGPYTAYDDDGIYDGWGWFMQAARRNDVGKLVIYQVLPVSAQTSNYITFVDNDTRPDWYPEYLTLYENWQKTAAEYEAEVARLRAANPVPEEVPTQEET